MIEVLKQAFTDAKRNERHNNVAETRYWLNQYKLIAEQVIAELESQEPVGWHLIEALYPQGERLDIRMGDGSILCNLLPQADGDLWWEGSGTGEKFIDPVYADVTHWRIHSNIHPLQRTWIGLTDEEIEEGIKQSWVTEQAFQSAAWWAEAKLKEKNT